MHVPKLTPRRRMARQSLVFDNGVIAEDGVGLRGILPFPPVKRDEDQPNRFTRLESFELAA